MGNPSWGHGYRQGSREGYRSGFGDGTKRGTALGVVGTLVVAGLMRGATWGYRGMRERQILKHERDLSTQTPTDPPTTEDPAADV